MEKFLLCIESKIAKMELVKITIISEQGSQRIIKSGRNVKDVHD